MKEYIELKGNLIKQYGSLQFNKFILENPEANVIIEKP